ncbi:MAG: hypothetical protein EXR92_05405 [Gemmatimonadetes bacterium]|nr:hypothetical protein [Gemmatimonadota bacterium]
MSGEGSVRLARMFCPARDRNIPVLLQDREPASDRSPLDRVPEPVACLDYAVRCTGWLCPHFALPTLPPESLLSEAMEAERLRQGWGSGERRSILERALREGRAQGENTDSVRPGR